MDTRNATGGQRGGLKHCLDQKVINSSMLDKLQQP